MNKVLRPLLYSVIGVVLVLLGWMIGTINLTLTPSINAPLPAGYVLWWFAAMIIVIAGFTCLYAGLRAFNVNNSSLIVIGSCLVLLIGFHANLIVWVVGLAIFGFILWNDTAKA